MGLLSIFQRKSGGNRPLALARVLAIALASTFSVFAPWSGRFVLVGTMNPEEGELRPQLLDRFGLTVEIAAPRDPQLRAEVVRRRLAFDADPSGFVEVYADAERALTDRIAAARKLLPEVELTDARGHLRLEGVGFGFTRRK